MDMDMLLTIVVLSFWFIFPIGLFLSVSHVDKNTDQLIRLDHLRHDSESELPDVTSEIPHNLDYRKPQPDYHASYHQ